MKFKKTERFGKLEITDRKIRLLEAKPERDRKRLGQKMPLLADQLPPSEPVDIQANLAARQVQSDRFERSMRALEARCWRESRRDYFSASEDVREEIRCSWQKWTGPRTSGNFRYVVDKHTGVAEARRQRYAREQAEGAAIISERAAAQGSLF